jgi:hypothetical protein
MADVVYLHVGAPKTGTTYIQDRLALNRTRLARHDVRYPIGLKGDMFRPALDLVGRSFGGVGSDVGGEWDALAKRVRRSKGTVLISHEILAGATREQVERAVGSLGSAEIHIVFTARDIARQVPAEWQERLKHRQVILYRRFLRQIQAPGSSSPSARTFWQVQGLTGVLERWSRHLTPDRVHVVTVPQPGAPHGELWRRFCRAVDVDPAWAPEDSPRRNPSIGVAQSMMLRELNRRLRAVGLAHSDYSALVRRLVVHETLASRPDDERLALPPQFRDWAEEVSETWSEWLVGSGVDIVGDLDDLRPVWPDPETEKRVPRRVRQRNITDAALDALVAVIEEAARRDDPRELVGSKLGKATRRLRGGQ